MSTPASTPTDTAPPSDAVEILYNNQDYFVVADKGIAGFTLQSPEGTRAQVTADTAA